MPLITLFSIHAIISMMSLELDIKHFNQTANVYVLINIPAIDVLIALSAVRLAYIVALNTTVLTYILSCNGLNMF